MDITPTIAPNSDQVNADDLIAGPQTVTITGVKKGSIEQPVFIELAEFPKRTYRPSKTMRRVLVAAWGPKAETYIGRRMTIYRDPKVTFGGETVGGIKISHLSHIDRTLTLALTASRGHKGNVTIEPLPDTPAPSRSIADRMHALHLDPAGMRAFTARLLGHEAGWADLTDDEQAQVTEALDLWETTGNDPTNNHAEEQA